MNYYVSTSTSGLLVYVQKSPIEQHGPEIVTH